MRLLDQIKRDWVVSRKAKDKPTVKALGYLYATASGMEKDKGRELSDDEVIGVIKNLIGKNNDFLSNDLAPENAVVIDTENAILSVFLPAMIPEEDIRTFILLAIAADKNMGQIMGGLKQAYGQTVDMKFASSLIKELTV